MRNTGARYSVNMISAVSAKGALRFAVYEGNTNAGVFIDFGKRLLHDSPANVYLIIDGHPAHRATVTKEFAASTEGRLRLVFLPGQLLRPLGARAEDYARAGYGLGSAYERRPSR